MALASISLLPDPPLPTDAEAVFDAKAGVSLTAQQAMVPQLNDFITGLNTYAPTIDGAASAGAQAQVAAQNAAMYAAIAQGASGVGPYGNPGDSLQVNPARNGLVFGPSDGNVGDVKISPKAPGNLWFPANGSIRAQSSAPTLFAALGLLSPNVAQVWGTITPSPAITGTVVDISSNQNSGVVIALLAGTVGAAMKSTDYGATWVAFTIAVLSGLTATCITCDGAGNWYAGTSNAILRSVDDGVTWTVGQATTGSIGRISAAVSGIVIATLTAASVNVWWGNNFGSAFTTIISAASAAVQACIANDGKGTWIIGAGTSVRRSTDDGNTWAQIFSAASAPTAIATDKQGNWMISGATASGGTYKSPDNGLTWNLITMATAAVTDITFGTNAFVLVRSVSPQVGYINSAPDAVTPTFVGILASAARVTSSGKGIFNVAGTANTGILRSVPTYGYDTGSQFKVPDFPIANGLQAWIKAGLISFGKGATFSSGFLNAAGVSSGTGMDTDGLGVMVAVGASGLIRRTVDYGVTWTTVGAGITSVALRAVVTNKKGLWIVSGLSGVMLRSTDNGGTWALVPAANHGFGTFPIAKLVIGLGDILFAATSWGYAPPRRSTDGGLTWSPIATLTGTYYTFGTDGLGVWIAGDNTGNVYRSSNNGVSFGSAIDSGAGAGIADIKIWPNGICLLSITSGTTGRRSIDRGLTWSINPFPVGNGLFTFGPNGYGLTYVANGGFANNVQYTADSGNSWAVCATNTSGVVQNVSAAVYTPQTGYVALGNVGTIFTAIVDTYI